MQLFKKENQDKKLKLSALRVEESQKLISAFAWLLAEDKKQNPSLYNLKIYP